MCGHGLALKCPEFLVRTSLSFVLGNHLMGSASPCNHQDRPWNCALGLVNLSTFQGVLLLWRTYGLKRDPAGIWLASRGDSSMEELIFRACFNKLT